MADQEQVARILEPDETVVPLVGEVNPRLAFEVLPLELLQLILQHALTWKPYGHDWEIQSLRLVCHAWLQAVDTAPVLWSILTNGWNPSWVAQCVQKSGEVPLTVVLNLDSKASVESGACIRSVKHRWQNVRYWGTDRRLNIPPKDLTNLGANLKHFSAVSISDLSPIQFSDSPHLRLRSLKLHRITLPWDSPVLLSGSLRHLDLWFTKPNQPSITHVVGILHNSPELRTTILVGPVSPSLLPENVRNLPTKIHLGHLRSLKLEMSLDATYQVLSRLSAPCCQSTSLDWIADEAPQSPGSLHGVLRYVKERLSPASSPTKATVTFSVERSYHVEGSGWDMALRMRAEEFEEFVQTCLKPHRPIPTKATFFRTFSPEGQVSWIDGHFPSITDLVVEGARNDVLSLKSILEYMSSGDRPAFTNLRRLQISYRPQVLEEITNMLRCWTDRDEINKELGLLGVPHEVIQDLRASYPDVKISTGLGKT